MIGETQQQLQKHRTIKFQRASLTMIVGVAQRSSARFMIKSVGSDPARCWALPLSLLCSCAHVEH